MMLRLFSRLSAGLLALLLACAAGRAANVFARCRVLAPNAVQYRITAAGFIHEPNWYLPAKTQTVTGANTWSEWFDLTDWPLHGKLNREGGVAEWPAMSLKVAIVGSGTAVAGCTFQVQLADAASTESIVIDFTESSGSDTIAFLLPHPLRDHAGEFETGTQMVDRHYNWALEATDNTAYLPQQFNLLTALWSVFDPNHMRKQADTLLQLGTSTLGNVSTAVMREKNLQTYGVTWHLMADPDESAATWAVTDGAAIANSLADPDGRWRAENMLHYVVCDEITTLNLRGVNADKLNGWFHDYLRNKVGETDESMGTPIDEIIYPAAKMYDATLSHGADLTTRKIEYYAGKFGQYWTAKQLRQTSDLVKASFAPIGGMRTETLPSDHSFFNAWGAPYTGMGYRGLDFFELGAQQSVDIISAEDWLGLNHMYGPYVTWTGQHALGYLSSIFRSAMSGNDDMELRTLLTPSDDGFLRLKAYSALAQGCKSIFFWTFGPTFVSTENYWSDLRSEYDGIADIAKALTLAEPVMYTAKPVSDQVALLYSVSHDMWNTTDPACFVENRLTWTGLRHLGIQPDILREEDIAAGKLANYQALYITSECVTHQAAAAIDAWVQNGGIVYLIAGAATRDEFNEPYIPEFAATVWPENAAELTFKQTGYSYNERNDLPNIPAITYADTSGGAVKVIGHRLDLRDTLDQADVLATFQDNGAIAGARVSYGTGTVVAYGFMPGLAYSPYTVGQATLDEVWPAAPRALMKQPLSAGGITGVVTPSVPVVEAGMLKGPDGAAIVLINHTYRPIPELKLTVRDLPQYISAFTTKGSPVTITPISATESEVKLPLEWTDIIVFSAGVKPTADPQEVTTPEDTAKAIVLTGSDEEELPLTFAVATLPSHGELIGSAPNLTYTPSSNYTGADSFAFTVNNGYRTSEPATVSITVTPVNDPPVAVFDSYTTFKNTKLTVGAPGVLENDYDVDNDALAAIKVTDPAHGEVTVNPDGGFIYTPLNNYLGPDSFTYKLNDGKVDSNPTAVSIIVEWDRRENYRDDEAIEPAPDGTYFCEAEEFKVDGGGWEAQPWGMNYYAATFANTFLSRKAFLGAPEQCAETTAGIDINVHEAKQYLVLVRYEAAYRFETQFRVIITQDGTEVFNRLYGARNNVKIWPFGEKLKTEVAWPWGADENIVWEGHDAFVDLQPGPATISLVAGPQDAPGAKRNVDLVMLTPDAAQVASRINSEAYLPLDGWLTQVGDVWLRAINTGGANATVSSLSFSGGPFQQHSPYWVHQRNWSPVSFVVAPGQTSDWVDVGGAMDTLNDGQWGFRTTGPCTLELGVRDAAGQIQTIRSFTAVNGSLPLTGYADTRYRRQVRTAQEDIDDLMGALNSVPHAGPPPSRTMIAAITDGISQLDPLLGLNGHYKDQPKLSADLRGKSVAQVEAWCQALTPEERANYLFISLGDEIPSSAGMKPITDVLRQYLPNAGIGANYSPHAGTTHAFLGEVDKWVTTFRDEAMTMPWSEDYIWGIPVGTPQMNSINLDLFRAGIRGKQDADVFKIMYYVMPHEPGNTPNMWRRMFYSAMGHGATLFNLFEYRPVYIAYTENYVNGAGMYMENLKTLRELSSYEDILQSGRVRPAKVALWFSEAGDNNNDYANSGGAGKRALYIAIRNQQLPLDFVVEADALDDTLNQYQVLYLTDRHVSQAASQKIAQWVQAGGRLFATAGAGMFDENNAPNDTLRALLGVEETAFETPEDSQVGYEKQDLPFVDPADHVSMSGGNVPVFGAISRFTVADGATVLGAFDDNSPAVIEREVGAGQIVYCGFLPGLSYFKPAIPLRPLDRGNTDDAMSHFMPTQFDTRIGALIGGIAPAEAREVDTGVPHVEATIIEGTDGVIIPLTNWSTTPANGLEVMVNIPVPTGNVSLSSGRPVSVRRSGGQIIFGLDLAVADTLILRGGEETLTADSQEVTTEEDTPVAITLTGQDPDSLPLTYTVQITPSHGELTGAAPNLTYTPAENYNGADSFTFTVNNGAETSLPAMVSIDVTPVNDLPVAVGEDYVTAEDTLLSVELPGLLENDIDVDGDALTTIRMANPRHGILVLYEDGGFTYTPDADYYGPDSFSYKAFDGVANSNTATVNLTVTPANDPPTANPQAVETEMEAPIAVTLTGSDPDDDPLTFAVETQPEHGILEGTAPDLVYTPETDYVGPDSFTFTVDDGLETSEPAAVSITVLPLNHPPTADPQEVETEEHTAKDIILTGSDPDGDPLFFTVGTLPEHGVLEGTAPDLTYTPEEDYIGPDSFTFTVNDGKLESAPATVTITVNPIQPPPMVSAIDPNSGFDNQQLDVTVTGDDFLPGAALTLTRPNQDDITATGVFVQDANTLAGTLDLNGKEVGVWTVVVTNPGGKSGQLVDGFTILHALQTHPADFNPDNPGAATNNDWVIDIAEVTHYGSHWKAGGAWPREPDPIDIAYVTNAGYLWRMGEKYREEEGEAEPNCWIPDPSRSTKNPLTKPVLNSAKARFSSRSYLPEEALRVTIEVKPAGNASAWAAQDQPPAGWTVAAISHGGSFDPAAGLVKWGPFLDRTARTLSYIVTPPLTATGRQTFAGMLSVDGYVFQVTGDREIEQGRRRR